MLLSSSAEPSAEYRVLQANLQPTYSSLLIPVQDLQAYVWSAAVQDPHEECLWEYMGYYCTTVVGVPVQNKLLQTSNVSSNSPLLKYSIGQLL